MSITLVKCGELLIILRKIISEKYKFKIKKKWPISCLFIKTAIIDYSDVNFNMECMFFYLAY